MNFIIIFAVAVACFAGFIWYLVAVDYPRQCAIARAEYEEIRAHAIASAAAKNERRNFEREVEYWHQAIQQLTTK